MAWVPPKSPYSLVQRQFYDNPWRLLVACVFCNLTKRVQAEPIIAGEKLLPKIADSMRNHLHWRL